MCSWTLVPQPEIASRRTAMMNDYSYYYALIRCRAGMGPASIDGGVEMLDEREVAKARARRRLRDRKRVMAMLRRRAKSWYEGPGDFWRLRTWDDVFEERERYAQLRYRCRRQCRGDCCGNPRRTDNVMSMQERRSEHDAREQCDELGIPWKRSRFKMDW